MNFSVVENIRKHTAWDSTKGFFSRVLMVIVLICLLPLILIFFLILVLSSPFQRKQPKHVSVWETFHFGKNLKLARLYVDEDELPDNIEFPKEAYDICLFRIRSVPDLPELRAGYFDYQTVAIEEHLYLLSFNKKGMSIWCVDTVTPRLEKVKDLESAVWNFGKENRKIVLQTTLDKRDIRIEIEPMAQNLNLEP